MRFPLSPLHMAEGPAVLPFHMERRSIKGKRVNCHQRERMGYEK